jgi:RNA polymerase sigma factor (sigma-70 family)
MIDNELIYLYRYEKLKQAHDMLIQRHLAKLTNYIKRLFRNTPKCLPIDYQDIPTIAYLAFDQTIRQFDLKQKKYNFSQAIFKTCTHLFINDIRRFNVRSHFILNHAISLDENVVNTLVKHQDVEAQHKNRLEKQQQLHLILKFLKTQPDLMQQIINLKFKDIANKEIAKSLNLSVSKVRYLVRMFICRSRQYVTWLNRDKQI